MAQNTALTPLSSVIYLASPYSAPTGTPEPRRTNLQECRFQDACAAAAHLMNAGRVVFSPIAHTHPIAVAHSLPKGWEYWRLQDIAMLSRCDELYVLQIPGWDTSKGVAEEIQIAKDLELPMFHMIPLDGGAYRIGRL